MATRFDRELHARYFLANLRALPAPYAAQDSQRVVLVRLLLVSGVAPPRGSLWSHLSGMG